jgi:hypothetical protein
MTINIDVGALANAVVGALLTGINNLLSPIPQEFMRWIIEGLQNLLGTAGAGNVLTHIPPEWTSQNPDVLAMFRNGILAEAGLAAIVLTIQGYRVTVGRVDMWEAVFRTGFMVICGMGAALWVDSGINVVNALSDFTGTAHLDIRTESMPNNLIIGIELGFALFFALLAWFKGAVGTLFIAILIASAPYIITLSALPLLEGLGRWWVEELTTWLLRPFLVAVCLRLGLSIAGSGNPMQFLFAIVAFWAAWKMDTFCRRFSVASWGSLAQMNLFRRGAMMAAGAFTGGATAAAGAAAGGATGGAAAAAGGAAAGAAGAATAAPLPIP